MLSKGAVIMQNCAICQATLLSFKLQIRCCFHYHLAHNKFSLLQEASRKDFLLLQQSWATRFCNLQHSNMLSEKLHKFVPLWITANCTCTFTFQGIQILDLPMDLIQNQLVKLSLMVVLDLVIIYKYSFTFHIVFLQYSPDMGTDH